MDVIVEKTEFPPLVFTEPPLPTVAVYAVPEFTVRLPDWTRPPLPPPEVLSFPLPPPPPPPTTRYSTVICAEEDIEKQLLTKTIIAVRRKIVVLFNFVFKGLIGCRFI
jgi:hypothetical protein